MGISNKELIENVKGSKFGLERETLRVDGSGRLALTPHPFDDDRLSKDFCENQLEIITPVFDSVEEVAQSLSSLADDASKALAEQGEYIWLYSNPPYYADESEINIASFDIRHSSKRDYRLKLERRYGKSLMLFSGIHFNMSFPRQVTGPSTDEFYMKLLKYSTKYSWLLVLLTAASPVYDKSFRLGKSGAVGSSAISSAISKYASIRNSKLGYWNQFIPLLDYSNLRAYVDSIQFLVDKGALFSASELYMPVRVKPRGVNSLEALRLGGIDHIELRMFDINPFAESGIAKEDLYFAYYLLLYFASLRDFDFSEEDQKEAVLNHKNASNLDLSDVVISGKPVLEAAGQILDEVEDYYNNIYVDNTNESSAEDIRNSAVDNVSFIKSIIAYQRKKLSLGNRYAELVTQAYKESYQEKMLSVIKERTS